ncbi:alpha/beta fold hydrolase [Microbacterium betulae]|uniref:Alpha/beta fold hydrolase n=1 Tax=Microbacterium betulae TaxID=2981139 RepID=A0AA97FKM6_9MICO|nr:alpha/beta fold hydrolase [Microbacterium sp. AB]WOF24528.1 alpha/beta fold hydrolase [Microbacterium sp. AB]
MNTPRRAASPVLAGVRAAATVLAAAFAGVVGAVAFLSLRIARRAVTPGPRVADVAVHGFDTGAQTITLSRTPDTVLPGRYGLFTAGSEHYLKLGAVLAEDGDRVRRKLLTQVGSSTQIGPYAVFSGWYYERAEELHLPFTTEFIDAPVGPCPAWLFPAEDPSADTWVVAVHGRGTTRAEVLRAVPVLHEAGMPVLCVSYRNDGEAPASRSGRYGLGATEWRDVDAAVAWALEHGALRIVLMGWSMGGAIVLQEALNSPHSAEIAGIVLESPVVDWRLVLGYQARELRVPSPLTRIAMGALRGGWSSRVVRRGDPISLDDLDIVARARELTHPILLLHSDDDGFVPAEASHRLAAERPDLVTMESFRTARHTKLWNFDERRWNGAIRGWLAARGVVSETARGGAEA